MEVLGERPAWSMSDTEKVSRLDATNAMIARLETYKLHLIADLDASGYAKDIGAGDTARFVSRRYRIDLAKARHDLRTARSLSKYELVAAALPDPAAPFADDADGNFPESHGRPIAPAQAAVIMAQLDKVPTTVPLDDLTTAERQLVNLARTFTPGELRDAAGRIRNILDTDGPEPDEHRAYQRESLTLKPADNGVKFAGYLANENAELFSTLIHSGAKPHKTLDGEPDPRARDKRQADALTALLNTAAGVIHTTNDRSTPPRTETPAQSAGNTPARPDPAPSTPRSADNLTNEAPQDIGARADGRTGSSASPGGYIPGHGPKAHLTITIDFDALKAAGADATGDTVFGDGLSAAVVRRLACDAQVLPVVLGSKSQPLDVGTTKRLVTGPMRLALNARDRGCVVCGAPPIQCEAHHLVHWINGGETSVSNLVLLCKRHHTDHHAGHWHIEITDGVVRVAHPAWATPDPIPRGRYKPPTYVDETNGAPCADAETRPNATIGNQSATPDTIRRAIWGDEDPPTDRRPPAPSRGAPETPGLHAGNTRRDTDDATARRDPWSDHSTSATPPPPNHEAAPT